MKTIDNDTYLKALALYTMACSHQAEAERYSKALNKLLGTDADSHLSDGVYSNPQYPFDEALAKEQITVEPEKPE